MTEYVQLDICLSTYHRKRQSGKLCANLISFDKGENCELKGSGRNEGQSIMYSFKVYTNNVFALNPRNDQQSKNCTFA